MTFECFGLLVMFCNMPDPPKTTTVVCPPVVNWSADLQKRAAAELKALPADAALRQLIPLAIDQRNINRRCLNARQGK